MRWSGQHEGSFLPTLRRAEDAEDRVGTRCRRNAVGARRRDRTISSKVASLIFYAVLMVLGHAWQEVRTTGQHGLNVPHFERLRVRPCFSKTVVKRARESHVRDFHRLAFRSACRYWAFEIQRLRPSNAWHIVCDTRTGRRHNPGAPARRLWAVLLAHFFALNGSALCMDANEGPLDSVERLSGDAPSPRR